MPRIYVQRDEDLDAYGCEAVDLCNQCWDNIVNGEDETVLSSVSDCHIKFCKEALMDPPDDGDHHPEYSDVEYDCYSCNKRLTAEDD